MIPLKFQDGQNYSRRKDIHDVFGGQRQGGISTPSAYPVIFIFTGESGEQHGYADGWRDGDVFLYTGEGQRGDMQFRGGNRAIRDHSTDGKELLLFQALGKSRPVRFMGRFSCQSWDTFRGLDSDGKQRECIQFHLVKVDVPAVNPAPCLLPMNSAANLHELRAKAIAAAKPAQSKQWYDAKQAYRKRSQAVRDYVLARANGRCELTGRPAPFVTTSGAPYLEVHHTRRLSDDGPDDPRFVAAICPTIHREIHFGENGQALNKKLIELLKTIEPKD